MFAEIPALVEESPPVDQDSASGRQPPWTALIDDGLGSDRARLGLQIDPAAAAPESAGNPPWVDNWQNATAEMLRGTTAGLTLAAADSRVRGVR